jgi:hypothetical protein
VAAEILRAGCTVPVAVEAGDRVNATWFEVITEYVPLACHVLIVAAGGGSFTASWRVVVG